MCLLAPGCVAVAAALGGGALMNAIRHMIAMLAVAASAWFGASVAMAAETGAAQPEKMLHSWFELSLELVRHTPTYSPPVASRALAYLGVTAFEAVASGSGELQSLGGSAQRVAADAATHGGRDLRRGGDRSGRDGRRRGGPVCQHRADRPTGHSLSGLETARRGCRHAARRCRGPQRGFRTGRRVAHSGVVAQRRRRGRRKHGLSAGVHADARVRRIGFPPA